MRVVFHLGVNKAGSTAIQATLAQSSDKLLAHGVYFPRLDRVVHHTQLLFAFTDDDEFRKHYRRWTPEGARHSREHSENLWRQIASTIETRKPHTLILSTEFGTGLRPATLGRILSYLERWSTEIELAAYVRFPPSHYLSAVQQGLKFGYKVEDPRIEGVYRRDLQKVARHQVARLHIRSFSKRALRGGCVCQDFLGCVVGLPDELLRQVPVLRSNESLSAEAMVLLQAFNRVHFPNARRPGNPLSNALIRAIEAAEQRENFAKPELTAPLRRLIENSVRDDMLWLRESHGLVFERFPYEAPHVEDPEMLALGTRLHCLSLSDVMRPVNPARVLALRDLVFDQLAVPSPERGTRGSRKWASFWRKHPLAFWRGLRGSQRKRRLLEGYLSAVEQNREASVEGLSPEDEAYYRALGALLAR